MSIASLTAANRTATIAASNGNLYPAQQPVSRGNSGQTTPVDRVSISSAGQTALKESGRTADEAHAAALAAQSKSPEQLTASELDRMQKAGGFVNTMAYLSPAEKALYDQAVASGNTEAAAGLAQIALIRTGGHTAGRADGTTYDPQETAISATNVDRYFRHSIIDSSGHAERNFQALIRFLHSSQATAT